MTATNDVRRPKSSGRTSRRTPRRRRFGLRTESVGVNIVNYFFAGMYALTIIIPLYYLIVSSFKDNAGIFLDPLAPPTSFNLDNYRTALEQAGLVKAMMTSFAVVAGTEIALLLVAFPAAYAIARMRGKMASTSEAFFAAGFLVPTFAMIVPVFLIIVKMKLLFNPLALIFVYTAQIMPFAVLILAAVLRTIPIELEDAATIDGASRLKIIRHVMFPLSRAGVVTVMIVAFIFVWNEFLFALILLGRNVRTIQIAVPLLKSERLVDFGLLSAGVVISLIPVFIMFVLFQEKIVKGLTSGAVKG